jgi:RimJ/RimL family protein N-acetyltransferase
MDFKEKIAYLRSTVFVGKIVDFHPYGMEYLEDIIRIRNQPEVKYFLAQSHDITAAQQMEWIKSYEKKDDEFGFIVKNKRNEVVGINFCFNYDPQTNSMEMGRGTFDLARLMGMAYTLDTITMTTDLFFDFLQMDLLTSVIKSDNIRLLRFFRKMNWTNTGNCIIRDTKYEKLELRNGQSMHKSYTHILDQRRQKEVGG